MAQIDVLTIDVGAITGIFGAITGSIALYFTWKQMRRNIKVSLQVTRTGYGRDSEIVRISAVNPSHRPITMLDSGILLPTGDPISFRGDKSFPYELADGASIDVDNHARHIAKHLKRRGGLSGTVQIKGYFNTALGTQYLTKGLKFDIDAHFQEPTESTSVGNLLIIDGQWGANEARESRTDKLRMLVKDEKLRINVTKMELGDPYPGVKKTLKVIYMYNGETRTKEVNEDGILELP